MANEISSPLSDEEDGLSPPPPSNFRPLAHWFTCKYDAPSRHTHTHTHGTLSLTLALSRRELNETGSTLPAEDTHCQTVRWMEGETLHVRKIRNDTKIEMLTTLAACSTSHLDGNHLSNS